MARACSVFQFLKYFCHPSEYLIFLFKKKVNMYFLHSSIPGGGGGGDLTTSLCVS